jgi:glycerate 2-kinase
MRVLFAPDGFGGTLSAAEAAAAMSTGWGRSVPSDERVELPLSDGGTGFVEVLAAACGGTVHELAVTGPLGGRVTGSWLELDGTAYVESATACGLHLVGEPTPEGARTATSRGVGELVADAVAAGVGRVVVGLGGSACTDGGAGMLVALGVAVRGGDGAPLADGGAALAGVAEVSGLDTAVPAGVDLVVAGDVDSPLTGVLGAARVFGPQKGADADTVVALDAALSGFGDVLGAAAGRPGLAAEPGAGAAGGLGAALIALGATRESGGGLVRSLVGLDAAVDAADLVVTGEGSFDMQSLRGKITSVVAEQARDRGTPCLVLAGRIHVGGGEAYEHGVHGMYATEAEAGSLEAALADPAGTLADLAEGVARHWGGR